MTSTIAGTKVITANWQMHLPKPPCERWLSKQILICDDHQSGDAWRSGNNQRTHTVKAHVDDQFGNPVADQLVTSVQSHQVLTWSLVRIRFLRMAGYSWGHHDAWKIRFVYCETSLANGSSYEKDLVVIDLRLHSRHQVNLSASMTHREQLWLKVNSCKRGSIEPWTRYL